MALVSQNGVHMVVHTTCTHVIYFISNKSVSYLITSHSPGTGTSLIMFSVAKFLLIFLGVDYLGT